MTHRGRLRNGSLEDTLPENAVASVLRGDLPRARLFPEEQAAVARAVANRRAEFATARECARAALRELGLPPGPIPVGPHGEPRWPPGTLGSITHCDGYRACAVARRADTIALGIDAEPNQPLRGGILEAIASAPEIDLVERLTAAEPGVNWGRMLFSAKEAAYKAWFPYTRRSLRFDDLELDIDLDGPSFSALLLVPGPRMPDGSALRSLDGRWALDQNGTILTAVAVQR